MKDTALEYLRCPASGAPLTLEGATRRGSEIERGWLVSESGNQRYPIINYVPRFVPSDNYASSFGLQWNRFSRTQLDSNVGVSISRSRFYATTGWTPSDLKGRRVLDVGCGAGRFVEVALDAGAEVVAADYSAAVDACWRNHRARAERLVVAQASVYDLPFVHGSFDFVYCLGVLQHTPDPRLAFMSLPKQLRPGGQLAIDVYPRLWRNLVWSKYWLRPVTRRMPDEVLFRLVERWVPRLFPLSRTLGRTPAVGRWLRYLIPVANYEGILPLNESQLNEWAILDTYDMLAPDHDHPQTEGTIRRWMADAELENAWTGRLGVIAARARKSASIPVRA